MSDNYKPKTKYQKAVMDAANCIKDVDFKSFFMSGVTPSDNNVCIYQGDFIDVSAAIAQALIKIGYQMDKDKYKKLLMCIEKTIEEIRKGKVNDWDVKFFEIEG